jgi:hypothetical protein
VRLLFVFDPERPAIVLVVGGTVDVMARVGDWTVKVA